jgi:amino acid transporter
LCCIFFFLIPFSFQGVLGQEGMLASGIVDGTGVGEALGNMIGGGPVITQIFVILMIMALFLAIMTAMAGSSRTLYQGSRDGWLPKYLGEVNSHGAPRKAMWTDFAFNVFLLALASDVAGYFYVLAISNVGYIMFNFLNLNAGWIHRIDSGPYGPSVEGADLADRAQHDPGLRQRPVPWRGAKVWGYENALWSGLIFASFILPVFWYRHYLQDGGKFPKEAYDDLGLKEGELGERKAGILPYLALIAGGGRGALGQLVLRPASLTESPATTAERPPRRPFFLRCRSLTARKMLHFSIAFRRESPETGRKSYKPFRETADDQFLALLDAWRPPPCAWLEP